jgi:hypothetical protein
MNLPLSDWTVVPAAAVLVVAFVCRLLRTDQNPLLRLASRWTPLFLAVAIFAGMWLLEARFEPIPLVFGLLFGLVETRPASPSLRERTRRAVPLLLGAVSAAVTFWVWSGGNFAPRFHDESAYLLQAGIFAEGRWSDPSPPLPEFFEQFHVLVAPVRAAKYTPGHALLLTPGVALGAPPAVPLFLVAGTAALLFVLTRRFAGERAAFLAWMVWTIAPAGLRQGSSYFSELTTSFLWLAVWWAILKWRDTDRPIWLSVAAFGASWGAITRPLTMLLFAVPLATVVLVRLVKRRRIRDVPAAAIAAILPLLLIPLWSLRTIGSWSTTPLAAYTRAYMPFDVPGFGADPKPPERTLPGCMRGLVPTFLRIHREHKVDALPRILQERVTAVLRDTFGSSRILLAFALLGATLMPREGILALITGVLILAGYLIYAHLAAWSIYYLELQPVMAAATGIGLSAAIGSLPGNLPRVAAALLVLALTVFGTLDVASVWTEKERSGARSKRLRAALASLPEARSSLVFVRCKRGADPHEALVQNGPGLASARIWLVHDLGERNQALRSVSPGRDCYLYDETRGSLTPFAAGRGNVP